MPTEHHDNKSQGIITSVEPCTLINVRVVEIRKTVEVPIFKDVEVEKPIFVEVEKKFERPVIKDKEYERPTIIDKEYERPVIVNKEIVVEVPIPVEKPYDKPVPIEVPYDVPVVSMEKVNQIASEAVSVIDAAKDMLKEVDAMIGIFRNATSEVNDIMKDLKAKLDGIKNYEIVEEKYKVFVPEYVKQKVKILGKVVSIGGV